MPEEPSGKAPSFFRSFRPASLRALAGLVRREGLGDTARSLRQLFHDFGWRGVCRRIRRAALADVREAEYAEWIASNEPSTSDRQRLAAEIEQWAHRPLISIVTPVYNTDPRWLEAAIASVRRQSYPNWELLLCDDGSTQVATLNVLRRCEEEPRIRVTLLAESRHIAGASNVALAGARGEFVAFLDHDDELAPEALAAVVRRVQAYPDVDLIYSDEDKLDTDGVRRDPFFKPDWSPVYFRSCMYVGHLLVIRWSQIDAVGGFREEYSGAQDYDLVLRVTERTDRIQHLPQILYHWRRTPGSSARIGAAKPWASDAARRALSDHAQRVGLDATIQPGEGYGLYVWRHRLRNDHPLLSVIITSIPSVPSVTSAPPASAAIAAYRTTRYPSCEWIVVSNQPVGRGGSERGEWAARINEAVAKSRGELVVVLDAGLEPVSPEWLERLVGYFVDPAVGVVAPRLDQLDGRIFSVGLAMRVDGGWGQILDGAEQGTLGYFGNAVVAHECAAVSAACFVTTRSLIDRIGGFDPSYRAGAAGVGFCLAARDEKRQVVCAAEVVLRWHGPPPDAFTTVDPADVARVRGRWPRAFEDPFFHPPLKTW